VCKERRERRVKAKRANLLFPPAKSDLSAPFPSRFPDDDVAPAVFLAQACPHSWKSREPDQIPPVQRKPVMEVEPPGDDSERKARRVDKLTARGLIIERREVFNLPTIEPERLLTGPEHELRPTPAIAFRIDGSSRPANETGRRPRKSAGLSS
jgi:hypothetical protein